MKKQSISHHQKIAPSAVAALLEQNHKPLPSALHISVPTQTRSSTPAQLQEMSTTFTKALNNITPIDFSNHPINDGSPQQSELNFGAPQIDLALPKDTFPVSGLHEFNPKYWRDQIAALTCTIALAVRQREQQQTTSPIYCFLSKNQTQLIEWVTTYQTSAFHLKPQDLIIITANHSDDLLWAIEETMHATNGSSPIIAHFNLLDNLSAQRLSFLAKTQQSPCFIVCNHKIDGPKHARSQWTIHQHPESKTTVPSFYLTLSQTNNESVSGWHLKWQQDQQRFAASREKNTQQDELILH